MANEVQAALQLIHEREGSIMVAAAEVVSEILAETGPARNLPADFPDSLLGLATKSLVRMQERQQKYDLDPQPVARAAQKLQRANLRNQEKNCS